MPVRSPHVPGPVSSLSRDFWKFWIGQTLSNLGSSFTRFALPLLIFKLTGSALNLAIATSLVFLPYLLFGLIIGAWVDRVDRKRFMIAIDLVRMVVISVIPLLVFLNLFSIWWIYIVAFLSSTLAIGFDTAQFTAVVGLVDRDALVTANGRLQASFSAANVVGPLLAGVMLIVLPITQILLFDALSFLISAASLALIRTSFNADAPAEQPAGSLRRDIIEGLQYVMGHPILRAISLMMVLVNFVSATIDAQLVLFAKNQLQASDAQVGLFFTAGSVGIVVLSLAAGSMHTRWSFRIVALGALMLEGLLLVLMASTSWYWLAVPLWAVISGLGILFNINTGSLRQAIVPNHLLGRVMSVAQVLAWSFIPLGTLIGGAILEWTRNIGLVYGVIGALTFFIAVSFSCTALGHAERYLPQDKTERALASAEHSQ
jgi:MFS family permease